MRVVSLALLGALLGSLAPAVAPAQDSLSMSQVQSPILTIDVDRLLAETQFGRRLAESLRERTEALAAENERLRIELTDEERSLTEQRPTMEVEAFRAAADAFDARVQRIRAEQDAKQSELEAEVDEGRQAFLNAVTPVLARLMIESGAGVMLERRDVFLSAGLIDTTDEAIAAIDAELGDGSQAPAAPAPEPLDPATPTLQDPGPAPEDDAAASPDNGG